MTVLYHIFEKKESKIMQDYALFMDVSGDVLPNTAKENGIHIITMEFIIENGIEVYDYFNSTFDLDEFYKKIAKKVDVKTSQISPTKFVEQFEPVLKEGKSVLYVCLSSGLSSTYSSACTASAELKEKYPELDVLVVDSLSATVGIGIVVERMIKNKQKGMTLQENFNDLQVFKAKSKVLGVINDLDMLKRGGRIRKTTAFFGGLLKIKPIVQVESETGTITLLSKSKGMVNGVKHLFDYYKTHRDENSDLVYISDTGETVYFEKLKEMIRAEFPNVTVKYKILSPIIGCHLGTGSLAIAFVEK